jgi:uncharacterized protein YkwD
MHRYFFVILLFSAGPMQTTIAQNSSHEINLLSPNLTEIERLTYESVNKLRKEKKLPGLIWDDVLYKAARDHANYLITEKKISHFQTISRKKTPAQRVKLHGGLLFTITGENLVDIPLGVQFPLRGRKRSTVTYEGSAVTMAGLWRASPGHYENIISKKYNCTALATAYDSTKQRLIAVQVFGYTTTPGSETNMPDQSDYLINLPIPTLPYGLKKYRYNQKNEKAVNGFLKMKMDRGFITSTYRQAKKVFKGRRSGIAQELIPLNQFDSTSAEFSLVPNRRNGLYELNGKLSKPVYRRELLQYSRRNTKRSYFIYTKLLRIKKRPTRFLYPMQPKRTETEFNLFLVKNKRLEVFKTYLNIPSKLFDVPFPDLKFITSFKSSEVNPKFRLHHTYDTLALEIFYSPQQVIIDSAKQYGVKQAFDSIRGKIIVVEAAAFASIEGDKSSNDQLARNRMDHFMTLVKPYLDTITVRPRLVTREQRDLFYKQIEGTRLQHLKKMNFDDVRRYVNQNKKDTLLTRFLNVQRYIRIKLIWRQDFKEYLPVISPLQLYDSLKHEVEKSPKPKQHLINALEKAQLALYHEWSSSDSITSAPPEVLDLTQYPGFKYHDLIFRYTVLRNLKDSAFYTSLHELAASKYFPRHLRNQLIYNNLVLIYRSFINKKLFSLMNEEKIFCAQFRQSEFHLKKFKKLKCPPHDFENLYPDEYYVLKEITALIALGKKEKISDFQIEELWKYYYLYTIHSLYFAIPIDPEIYQLLPGFKDYIHPDDKILNEEERLKLAYFYCALLKYSTARDLLEPIVNGVEPNKEALKLYLSLKSRDFKDEHEFASLLISEFSRLGKSEWCDLWLSGRYLNFLLFEDLKLKNFFNCHCER